MKKVKTLFNEICIIANLFISNVFTRNKRVDNPPNMVLIIFSGVLGDSVMFLDSLYDYIGYFLEHREYELKIIVKPLVMEFFESISVPYLTSYIEVIDLYRYLRDYAYFKAVNKKFGSQVYKTIVSPLPSTASDILAKILFAQEKITIGDNSRNKGFLLYRYLRYYTYTKYHLVAEDMSLVKRFKYLSNLICNINSDSKLPQISLAIEKDLIIPKEDYCVICPTTSTSAKNWEFYKFRQIIEYLESEKLQVCISIPKTYDIESIILNIKNARLYTNTSLAELIYLLKNAKLVIGCDSAPVHLSAALGIQSICILSGRDKELIFPYGITMINNTISPTIIRGLKKQCFGCHLVSGKDGYGNTKCRKQIMQGRPGLCIQEIAVSQVVEAINQTLGLRGK